MIDRKFCLNSSDGKLPDWHELAPFVPPQSHEKSTIETSFNSLWQSLEQSAHHSASFPSPSPQASDLTLAAPDRDFLSMISHELRSPLANIQMAIDLLRSALEKSGVLQNSAHRVSDYFHLLESECRREIQLVNDLLDLSRIEATSEPPALTQIDLNHWLHYVTEAFSERSRIENKQFTLDLSTDLPLLETNPPNLDRILSELLHNALKYTPLGEKITLSARHLPARSEAEAGAIALQVCNTGVELSADDLPRLFEKFYRVQHSHLPECEGSGLGLALVQRRVENLGATITVESSHQQVCFTVLLPSG
jgi:signal transduction histidine kinase